MRRRRVGWKGCAGGAAVVGHRPPSPKLPARFKAASTVQDLTVLPILFSRGKNGQAFAKHTLSTSALVQTHTHISPMSCTTSSSSSFRMLTVALAAASAADAFAPLRSKLASPPAVRVFATAGGEPSTPEAMLAAAEALRVEVAAFETERLSEAKAAAFAAFSVADSDGDGVLGKEDVASFLKVDEALAVKVMATFDVDEAGALTIDSLLPRTNSGEKGTLETVSGALFAVTLKGALRDVLAAEREASRTASDEDASREAAKAEFASVASRTDAAARATAAAAFLLPLFDVANEYGGHLIAGALHGGNPAASAAAAALAQSAALFNAVPFGYFGAFFVLSGAAADPSKPELVRVASRTAVLADIALQGPKLLFAVALFAANTYGATQGVDAMALQLDPNANAALSALAALDLTAFNDGVAAVAGAATLYAFVSNALGVKADKIPLLSQSAQDYVDRRTPDFDIDNDGDGPQPSF